MAVTQRELAGILGIYNDELCSLLSGRRRFGKTKAKQLEARTGIDLRVWLFGSVEEIRHALEARYGAINSKRGRPRKETGETAG